MPYSTRQQALAISFSLGCPVGAHRLDDGQWNPCRSDSAYREAKGDTSKRYKPPIDVAKQISKSGIKIGDGFSLEGLHDLEAQFLNKNTSNKVTDWISNMLEEVSPVEVFRVPQEVLDNMDKGLENGERDKELYKYVKSIVDTKEISAAGIERMQDFFKSSSESCNKEFDDSPASALPEWLLWGGDAGYRWALNKSLNTPLKEEDNNINKSFTYSTNVCKVSTELGLVFGWAIICKQDGQEYFDTQGDHIPEEAMLEASTEFSINSRIAKDMHRDNGELPGCIAHTFPLTEDTAKAFGIECQTTGLMIAMKPDDPEIFEKFRSGEYTGFSIGGKRITDEEI